MAGARWFNVELRTKPVKSLESEEQRSSDSSDAEVRPLATTTRKELEKPEKSQGT